MSDSEFANEIKDMDAVSCEHPVVSSSGAGGDDYKKDGDEDKHCVNQEQDNSCKASDGDDHNSAEETRKRKLVSLGGCDGDDVEEDDEGFKTPTGEEYKIKIPDHPPPVPRKPLWYRIPKKFKILSTPDGDHEDACRRWIHFVDLNTGCTDERAANQ